MSLRLAPAAMLAAGVLAAFAAPALAEDPRILSLAFRADVVERVDGHAGVEAAIAFGEDEHIENVAIGDAELWQVTPNKRVNMLFVKPLRAAARTNLTVITDRHSYFFDLVAGPQVRPIYLLRFRYPDPPRPPPAPAPLTGEEQAIASGARAALPVDPADLDFAWRSRGKPALTPRRVFDDGRDTYLDWPEKTALPAVLVSDAHGVEGPVNFSMKGTMIVVEGVPQRITLRAGKDSAVIEHLATRTRPALAQGATPPATPTPAPGATP